MTRTILAALLTLTSALPAAAETRSVEAGPIWNQGHADQVCPAVAQATGGTWTGHWWTTVAGQMSVCQVDVPDPARSVEAGPIWNQGHAEQVCPAVAAATGGTWTGHWWTTIPNEMSVCQVR